MKKHILFILLALGIVFTGCSNKVAEKAAEKKVEKIIEDQTGGKADVNISEKSMEIKTEDGELNIKAGTSAKLPEHFPSDVFIYKNAEIKMSMEMPQGNTVSFQTKESKDQVIDNYKKKMKAKGWSQAMAMDMGEAASLTFKKGKRITQVTIAKEDESTIITLMATKISQ